MATKHPNLWNAAPRIHAGMDYVLDCGRKNVGSALSAFVVSSVGVLAADSTASSPDNMSVSLSDDDTRNTARPLIML